MHPLLKFLAENWWWLLWPVLAALGALKEAASDALRVHHKRQMRRLRIQAEIHAGIVRTAEEAGKTEARAVPGPCVHRNVVPVVGADERVKAWLCKTCDTQLPPDWAAREEDL